MTNPIATRWRSAWQSLQGSARMAPVVPIRRPRSRASDPAPHPWRAAYPETPAWDSEIPIRPLTAILEDAVLNYPDRPCLSFQGKRHLYRDVDRLVSRLAKGLQGLGVGRGTPVALVLPNTPFHVIAFHAVLRAGGCVVNLNPLYAPPEIEGLLRDSGARIAIALDLASVYDRVAPSVEAGALDTLIVCRTAQALPLAGKALFAVAGRKERARVARDPRHPRLSDLLDNDGLYTPVPVDPERDVAVLQYTGGTTGIPKAALLTHANLYANAVQTRLWGAGLRSARERIVGVLPLFHAFGMTGIMNAGLVMGAELILLPRFKVKEVVRAIERHGATVLMGVPTMFDAIAGYERLDRYDLSSLTYCLSGGAPLPRETRRAFEAATGCSLLEGYGLTEAGPVCTANPPGHRHRPGSVGLPLPRTVVEIVDLNERDRLLPTRQAGEICIRGPQVMLGYQGAADETAEALRGGRLHTGDVGYLDGEGYLHVIDRIKDLILVGGFNVYPRVVEEALQRHPDVREAAVVGVPDRHMGEAVKAYVKPRDGADVSARELRHFLRERLASFEVPRRIAFRDDLPRTHIGKVSRQALRDAARTADRDDEDSRTRPGTARPDGGRPKRRGPARGGRR